MEGAGGHGRPGGKSGEGPCTNRTSPNCTDRSPSITLASQATIVGPFFGAMGTGTGYIYLNGNSSSATQRIKQTLVAGSYGDAYTDLSLSVLTLGGTHSMEVHKEYQQKVSGNWVTQATTPGGNPGTVDVWYAPPAALSTDLFYRSGVDAGKEIGFLNDAKNDFDVSANCSGWEFQSKQRAAHTRQVPRAGRVGPARGSPARNFFVRPGLLRPQGVCQATIRDRPFSLRTRQPGYGGSGSKVADRLRFDRRVA